MLRASDDLLCLISHLNIDDVRLAASLMNHADPTVVTPVRHSLVNGRVEEDRDFLPRLVCSQDSAQPYLSSLTRPLTKKGPCP
jgi:hypothetical protein